MEISALSIIYQDHHMLVVNKPAGIVIHPTYKHANGTLWDALLTYSLQQGQDGWSPPDLPDEPEWRGAPVHIQQMLRDKRQQRLWKEEGLLPRPCLLHRLDKDTSGVVALARTEKARTHLARQFNEHRVEKEYLAVVQRGAHEWAHPRAAFSLLLQSDGQAPLALSSFSLENEVIVISGALQRDPDDRRRCIVGPEGQEAITQVRVVAVEGEYALLVVKPITGRTHQIRAHLAAAGYAIVGDPVYAPLPQENTGSAALHRQFLHAYRLTLSRYPDEERISFQAPLAQDLLLWLEHFAPSLLAAWHFFMPTTV